MNEDRLRSSILEACALNVNRDSSLWSREEVERILSEMSPRERQITDLLRAGLSNGAIAERLGLSPRSVQGHRNKVYQKLRVHNAADFASRMSVL
ncbi:MAG: response regulator transcription factor [Duodenibacillus sp.]|nr:response regulator transcription factor [Duodenibacillus sp.]